MRKPTVALACPACGKRVHLPLERISDGSGLVDPGGSWNWYQHAHVGRCPECFRVLVVEIVACAYFKDPGVTIADIQSRPIASPIIAEVKDNGPPDKGNARPDQPDAG